ncbi:MAG TPA: glycosyltransferase [Acidimicrobiales bacterium]|nr:glycosyltransferase [Acidimicrobiales bacterium]
MERQRRPAGVSPLVSVVLVHTELEPVSAHALAALDTTSWPGGAGQVLVVDCTARNDDGRQGHWRAPAGTEISVVQAGAGCRLAEARNLGAARAAGRYVAFLAAGARPPQDWLQAAVEVFEGDGSVACVAPGVEGAPGGLSFSGHPAAAAPPAEGGSEVLYPSTEAMVVVGETFLAAGGFDADYERFGEEVDFGWRLWLLGHRVRACPAPAVSVAAVAEPAVEAANRQTMAERNALATIFKHYDERSLAAALPAAIGLGLRRGAAGGDQGLLAAAKGVNAFFEALPELIHQRAAIQDGRQRTDQELVRLFRVALEPGTAEPRLVAAHEAVTEAFELVDRFGGRRNIAIVTPDVLSPKMAGPAIRAWNIAQVLSTEHDVQLVTITGLCTLTSERFPVRAVTDDELEELEKWADVLILQGFVLQGRPFLRDSRKVLVFDVYDPLHLEQLELARDEGDGIRRGSVRVATQVLNDQLCRGDFFLCASPKQRDFWLGQMAALGRINPLTYDEDETMGSLIGVVPFGLPTEPPAVTRPAIKNIVPGIEEGDDVILWGGGIYNWFDPLTLVEAVDRLRRRRPRVRLFFMGLKHPNPSVPKMRVETATRELSATLGLTGTHVFFNEGWVAYDDRHNYLLEADIGVSTHLDHVETAFSARTRILDYVWAALPVVATDGDGFADLIEREALGITVPPGDVEALEEALFRILDDEELSSMCRKNLAAVRVRFAWPEVLEPLVRFCRFPRRAPDLADPEMRASLNGERAKPPMRGWQRGDLQVAIGHLRQGGLVLTARRAMRRVQRTVNSHR